LYCQRGFIHWEFQCIIWLHTALLYDKLNLRISVSFTWFCNLNYIDKQSLTHSIIRGRNCLPFAGALVHPSCWSGLSWYSFKFSVFCFVLFCFLFFCFFVCVFFFFCFFFSLSSSCVLCNLCCQVLWIVYSWLHIRFSLTFIYRFISNWIYYYCHTYHKISFVQGAVVIVW